MAKAKLRAKRQLQEIGAAIIAAWFKVLPDVGTDRTKIRDIDPDELKQVLSEILESPFELLIEERWDFDADPQQLLVPQPPVASRTELIKYLKKHHDDTQGADYHRDLGVATLFGCGR